MTMKSHDIISQGLEWSRAVWKDWEESRDRITLRDMGFSQYTHSAHMYDGD